jgi:2-amino-4-hydroxy-6-hydroxymethyldihydropteridine diphosphokinase
MDKINTAYIALGSNIGDRASFLKFGLESLESDVNISIITYSSIYETSPIGYVDQADFLNMVVEINTSYEPLQLLHCTQTIQKDAGRKNDIRWGPRTLDLDILLYNQENIEMEQLIVPHPRMYERGFVIVPLKEINSGLYFPSIDKSVEQVYKELSDKEGVRLWKYRFGEDE